MHHETKYATNMQIAIAQIRGNPYIYERCSLFATYLLHTRKIALAEIGAMPYKSGITGDPAHRPSNPILKSPDYDTISAI
jgi:hypothetical protein